ncbi:MAG: GTPase ObgE [bacterium]|nr:GTPase ObgE [bacterium]
MIDLVKIRVKAGDGGDGRVSFLHLKYKPKGGPDGGDGGDGGDVWLVADPNYPQLDHLTQKHLYQADSGQPGGKNKKTGKSGQDIILKVPPGTWVWQVPADFKLEGHISKHLQKQAKLIGVLEKPNDKLLAAKGGKGGKGNWRFRTSTDQAPQYAQPGTKGEDKTLVLELKLLADVGLIGLPNAGKSSLLKALTKADPKIAAYPFTTLSPHLGVLYPPAWGVKSDSVLLADIPGLITGASKGKGLGYQFLRHIQRSQILVHLIEPAFDLKNQIDVKTMKTRYQAIRAELKDYSFGLDQKPEMIVISKADLLTPGQKQIIQKHFKPHAFVSIKDEKILKSFVKSLIQFLLPLKQSKPPKTN